MMTQNFFHFSLSKTTFINLCIILFSSCITAGCTNTKLATINHTQQFSKGIQNAFSVHPTTANRVAPMILQSAESYNISPHLLAALIRQESSYITNATSSADAVGLTQVRPKFWQQTCLGNLYDEQININCGAYILSKYYQATGDWMMALGYYNVGPTGYKNSVYMRNQAHRYANSVKRHEKTLKEAL